MDNVDFMLKMWKGMCYYAYVSTMHPENVHHVATPTQCHTKGVKTGNVASLLGCQHYVDRIRENRTTAHQRVL